tara:strand:- start:15 stop:587 length:573 start_codon:yes stop_codon:yes gene_type:complete
MSDLTITTAGVSESISSDKQRWGTSIRIRPTISGTAYDAEDVLCLTQTLSGFGRIQGGYSRITNITTIRSDASAIENIDYSFIFMGVDKDLIAAISPGSSGGSAISPADIKAAKIKGMYKQDSSDNSADLGTNGAVQSGVAGANITMPQGLTMKCEEGSRDLYVGVILESAADYVADGDLEFVFDVEYLD